MHRLSFIIGSTRKSAGTIYVTEKRVPQWQSLMKKFSGKHKEKCKSTPSAGRPILVVKDFPTGSAYEGDWEPVGMSGYGEYTFPNGVQYQGDFIEGMFHGKGELRYEHGNQNAVIRGKWENGVMKERTLIFSDTLEYHEKSWKYCRMPDRRFAIEYDIDLMPAGKSYLTADQPTKEIPPGLYDTGDGFYDPKAKVVYRYNDLTAIRRSPSVQEQKWIIENCRTSTEHLPLGPLPYLYETWSPPTITPAPVPPPAAGIKTSCTAKFSRSSIFDFDFDAQPIFYDFSKVKDSSFDDRFANVPIRF